MPPYALSDIPQRHNLDTVYFEGSTTLREHIGARQMPPPDHIATAEFTADMVETLLTFFQSYEVDGIVRVEVTSHGLWLPNPHTKTRQFLGLARLPDQSVLRGPSTGPH